MRLKGRLVWQALLVTFVLSGFLLSSRTRASGQESQTLTVDVRMVEVYASVFDVKGHRVQDLQKGNFEISEDGVRQKVEVFEPQVDGLTIALLVDTTASMEHELPRVKNAIGDLLNLLSPDDNIGLFSFSSRLKTLQPFTKDRSAVMNSLMSTRAEGGTALYDALAQLARDLSKTGGKKVILLFTDGLDNRSVLTLQSATTTIRRVGVPIYTVAQGEILQNNESLKRLRALAAETNGIAFEARSAGDFRDIFVKVAQDLEHLYLLGYYSTNPDPQAEWRRISVRVPQHPDFKLRAKEGYWR